MDGELKLLYEKLKELEEKHLKYQNDLTLAIEDGDGLHDNALWQSSQDKFNENLQRINRIKNLIRIEESRLRSSK